ncbi:MAG: undecaprenyl-phosphate glucose phosphotransferase [Hyphomicrobium sp.]|nr:undecaprenyl-phosphate glucose phosphotransferase [Hyphomicrobium sp.]
MFGSVGHDGAPKAGRASKFAVSSTAFAATAFVFELSSIIAIAVVTGIAYHAIFYSEPGVVEQYVRIGGMAGLVYALTFLVRDEYSVVRLLEGHRDNMRAVVVWSATFVVLAAIGFLTKSTAIFSRGWLLSFYTAGLPLVIALNAAVQHSLMALIHRNIVRRRRLMIVGCEDEIARLTREISDGAASVYVAARAVIPANADGAETAEFLHNAAANARALGIEDVVISSSLSRTEFLDQAIAAFQLLPVAIHVGASGLLVRFKDAEVARFGRATTLSLTRHPLGPFEALFKRAIDVVTSGLALVLLSPLLAILAALVKLDSPGPVFFRQRRRGYNLVEFDIWKFRTMSTLDNGDVIQQATENDARVTRFGALLRKYSLDELPQLINVFFGEMSLVGPRPHAVAHDEFFEKRIAMYPRRLNMKPGITGWAQVNGFRGATEVDEKMQRRVEHDLYYIDNWSVAFDAYIVLLTIFSRKASQNAY